MPGERHLYEQHCFLDYAATTPLDPLVLEAMLPFFRREFANPASVHRPGQRARRAVAEAREQVAAAIGARPVEVIFTSVATEADNHALRLPLFSRPQAQLLTSRLEHAAVLNTARQLAAEGRVVSYVEPDETGTVTPEAVRRHLHAETGLVALMLVNNETGIRTDIAAISELAHEVGALVFCDAVQGFGLEEIEVERLGVDLMSLSAHKIYGPKGIGVLYAREGLELGPLLFGGAQERGRRAGTLNVPAIVGLGVAAGLAAERWREDAQHLACLRDAFEAELLSLPEVTRNGEGALRGPKHSNLRIAGVDGDSLLMALDVEGVYASAGSACSAGSLEPSHVLIAMGLDEAQAKASFRFTFGRDQTLAQVQAAAERVAVAVRRCRSIDFAAERLR